MIHLPDLTRALLRYREPDLWRALFEVCVTAMPLGLLWLLMWLSLDVGYWLTLLLAIPTAGFMVRLFIIQHDCGHGAFFQQRAANAWLGRVLGVLTLTPYEYWKRNHAIHHATSNNLDRRGIGDIDTLTVDEYRGRSLWSRFLYRCYRSAPVMFVIGPAYMFFLQHRLPFHQWRDGWGPWISTMATNAAIAATAAGMIWLVGLGPFLMVHLPVMLLAASMGVWLFYVQHQFENTVWVRTVPGRIRTPPCWAVPITTCRHFCIGSPAISASTISTISTAGFPITVSPGCCAISPSSRPSAGSPSWKASAPPGWRCGASGRRR